MFFHPAPGVIEEPPGLLPPCFISPSNQFDGRRPSLVNTLFSDCQTERVFLKFKLTCCGAAPAFIRKHQISVDVAVVCFSERLSSVSAPAAGDYVYGTPSRARSLVFSKNLVEIAGNQRIFFPTEWAMTVFARRKWAGIHQRNESQQTGRIPQGRRRPTAPIGSFIARPRTFAKNRRVMHRAFVLLSAQGGVGKDAASIPEG